MNKYAGKHC